MPLNKETKHEYCLKPMFSRKSQVFKIRLLQVYTVLLRSAVKEKSIITMSLSSTLATTLRGEHPEVF